LSNPFHYSTKDSCTGTDWVDYELRIHDRVGGSVWSVEKNRHIPLVDEFDLKGRFTANDGTRMSYAYFDPGSEDNSVPLIIWLHGGGEGGSDPRIPLLANRAANYASDEIQEYFGGAYVLVPQCPGAWMHNSQGVVTWGRENDVYNRSLMELIRRFVAEHPGIDPRRIYLGGCSNGGYMSLKLILLNPDYFAAGFISALAYKSEYLSEEELGSISQVPIWLIHSRDDHTTRPGETAVPVYQRLMSLGAANVHMSYYDHVIDISGSYGGADRHYPGHWSWIYSHANHCRLDFDGKPVTLEGRPVTLMSWLAAQRNEH
jgi:predicted peptidase